MTRRLLIGAVLLALLGWARPAAATARLGFGADWLTEPDTGALQLTLAGDTPLAKGLAGGGRIGLLLETGPGRLGVPIDGLLRLRLGRFYVEGLVGPWISFDGPDTVRLHAAIGFGLVAKGLQVGLEVGYLDPTSMLGVRLAIPI
jgi:hypothetical protein